MSPRFRPTPVRSFTVLISVAMVAMLLGVAVGRGIRSPAQEASETRPPAESVITARVTTQEATGEAVTRGTVEVGRTVSIGPVRASTPTSVVTGVYVVPGKKIRTGARLIEVSGRPVLLLRGRFGAYRDLRIGDSGPDAGQVNRALVQLGLPAPAGRVFTARSSSALAALYRRWGYAPPPGRGMDRREVAFAPDASATVTGVAARVGGPAGAEGLVVLSSGETAVRATMDPSSARTVHVGDAARIHFDDTDAPVDAEVTAVTVGDDVRATLVILRPEAPIGTERQGADVRVVVTTRSPTGPELRVPVTAVFSREDGQPAIVVRRKHRQVVVQVRTGPVVGGFVGVTPASDGRALAAGDEVIVSGPGLR